MLLPVYQDLKEAIQKHPDARILVNFASLRVAYEVAMEAMSIDRIASDDSPTSAKGEAQLTCIAIIAEGIPENFTRQLISRAKDRNILLIGPATVSENWFGIFIIITISVSVMIVSVELSYLYWSEVKSRTNYVKRLAKTPHEKVR